MSDQILQNDLLQLSDKDIKQAEVKFNINNGYVDLISEYNIDLYKINKGWMRSIIQGVFTRWKIQYLD